MSDASIWRGGCGHLWDNTTGVDEGCPTCALLAERDELRAEVERLKFIANDRSGEQQYQRIEKRAEKAEAALREIRGIALGLGAAGIAGHVDILGIVEIALHDAAPAEQPEAGEP